MEMYKSKPYSNTAWKEKFWKRKENSGIRRNLEQQDIPRGTAKKVKEKRFGGRKVKPRAPNKERGERDYSIYRLTWKDWLFYGALGLAFCGLIAYIFYRSIIAFFIMAPVGILYPLYKKKDLKDQQLFRLKSEFKEAIVMLSSFLSAGYSMENALMLTRGEMENLCGKESVMAEELGIICGKVKNNRPVEEGILNLGERSGLEDIYNFAQVFTAAKRNGGDLVDIIRHTSGVIRDKIMVQEEIRTMTAARVFEQKIMNMIPFLLVLYIDTSSPGFFDPAYSTAMGRLVMSGCLAVYLGAVLLSKKILQISL